MTTRSLEDVFRQVLLSESTHSSLLNFQITRPNFAVGSLNEFVHPISINANHVGMVKFKSSADPNFFNIAEYLVRLTGRHVDGGELIRPHTFTARPPIYASQLSKPSHTMTGLSERSLSDDVTRFHISAERDSRESAPRTGSRPKKARSNTNSPSTLNSAELHHAQLKPPLHPDDLYSHRHVSQSRPLSTGSAVLAMPDTTSPSERENTRNLSRLNACDVIFVIDDTNSMDTAADSEAASKIQERVTTRWDVLMRGMQYIADIAARHDENVVDVFFLLQ